MESIEQLNQNCKKYSDDILKRTGYDVSAKGFCGFYFAIGVPNYNSGDSLKKGQLMAVLTGPILSTITDRQGDVICYPELAGLSATICNGEITKFY